MNVSAEGFGGNNSSRQELFPSKDSLAVFEESEMPLEDIFKLTIEVIIALLGIIGNILVITVISKLGKKKQPAEFYLQNLAIADLGTLLLIFPIASIKEKAPLNWPFGEFGCRYLYPVPDIFFGASVWFIVVIAIERYRKVVTVKTHDRNKNKTLLRRAMAVAVCVWMASFIIFCLPLYFVVEYVETPDGVKWCGPAWDHQGKKPRVYIGILTLFSYIMPLAIISFTYLMISRTIKRSSVFIQAIKREENATTRDKEWKVKSVRLNHNKRVKKILSPLVLVFAVTMLPLNILRVTFIVWPAIAQQQYYVNLLFAVTVFLIINSSVNPVIYCVVSRDFRKGIKQLFSRRQAFFLV